MDIDRVRDRYLSIDMSMSAHAQGSSVNLCSKLENSNFILFVCFFFCFYSTLEINLS